jgi:hypothetical protein
MIAPNITRSATSEEESTSSNSGSMKRRFRLMAASPGYIMQRMRALRLVMFALVSAGLVTGLPGAALSGHDNLEVDPALRRHAGQVMALGAPDGQGRVYSFQLRRLPAAQPFAPDELRGWRLTWLAGKRFAHVFEVAGNGGLEITVSPLDGPLEGIAVKDVFVVENIAVERASAAK